MANTWPEDHDKALIRLHATGISFSQIAAELAREFRASYTRNAVIGRAKRMGLPERCRIVGKPVLAGPAMAPGFAVRQRAPRPTPPEKAAAPKREAAPFPRLAVVDRTLNNYPTLRHGAPELNDLQHLRAADVTPLNLSLDDLKPNSCRWRYGGYPQDTPITFCGHPQAVNSSYCCAHMRLSIGRGTPSERAAHRLKASAA